MAATLILFGLGALLPIIVRAISHRENEHDQRATRHGITDRP
jgi:hypothetical protein